MLWKGLGKRSQAMERVKRLYSAEVEDRVTVRSPNSQDCRGDRITDPIKGSEQTMLKTSA